MLRLSDDFFSVENLSIEIAGKKILENINFELKAGGFLAVLGPNGSGKSTLLRAMSHADLKLNSTQEWAKRCGLLSGGVGPWIDIKVEEYVELGRYPFMGAAGGESLKISRDYVDAALGFALVKNLKNREIHSLSSGEFQRVALARVFAQLGLPGLFAGLNPGSQINHKILLLDEPFSHLDLYYQHNFLKLLKNLSSQVSHEASHHAFCGGEKAHQNKDQKVSVICVIHDVNIAEKYADAFLLIKGGEVLAFGDKSVLTPQNLSDLFEVEITAFYNEKSWGIKFS